jgi:hypothetical protein
MWLGRARFLGGPLASLLATLKAQGPEPRPRCDVWRGFPLSAPLISFQRLLRHHPPVTTGPGTPHNAFALFALAGFSVAHEAV